MKQGKGSFAGRVGQVWIAFTDKPITAWGGVASVVATFLERVDWRSWVERSVPIRETSNNARGVYEKVLAQLLTVLCGGDRFAHMSWWGHGVAAMKKAFGVEWLPRASSTLTRFWGKVDSHAMAEAWGDRSRAFARQVVSWEGITEDTLNLDSSVLTRYGRQEGAKKGYNPRKHGRPSHHPLLAFLGSGYVMNVWNRSGDTWSGQSAREFFQQTVETLGEGFRIRCVLADTGFYQAPFIEYLEGESYRYIIAAPMSEILQRQIYQVPGDQWRAIAEGIEVADFWFEHKDQKWTRPRRYVAVRQEITRRPKAAGKQPSLFKDLDEWKNYRFSAMITNDQTSPPEAIWQEYRPRSCDENVVKDLKEGYGFAGFCLHGFWATDAVMVLTALVFHNLLHYVNRTILSGQGPVAQLKTIRSKWFILPALLGRFGRAAVLRLGVSDRRLRAKLTYFLQRIQRLPWRLNCNAVDGGGAVS